jgi:hypothetical protein
MHTKHRNNLWNGQPVTMTEKWPVAVSHAEKKITAFRYTEIAGEKVKKPYSRTIQGKEMVRALADRCPICAWPTETLTAHAQEGHI